MIGPRAFDVPCRIAVEQSEAHFHAHVELAGNIAVQPGDKVRVHGDPIRIPFGQSMVIDRMATVERAGLVLRSWTRLVAYLGLTELYEVSFNPGSMK
ncbi:MAG: hypothetical protein B7Y36_15060 [Novosphingobium sp. 28-62-57]|uniref:hypothetical protein n=1 Tax=unclassified Novosphingobium TaxID=2644732 RepID=UPI000BD5C110|nr:MULTISPECIES: hypothetical protein [unclassified Novosphingobium]OYW49401.1 MAG: hypothetical protein B7Z34_09875 [Novosphingobium sp. 12-62-10]OYZ09153.1 MAG: hypothetical protein B7Y36_15060 [Novosphingobium sp. 28-62-57]OZA32977.1 MAG: hypothetical protein B7X92_11930 [Novosphingobium sp. 17-62-9]HQS68347.1 hypothetical protein [Novosphingobium sp.]